MLLLTLEVLDNLNLSNLLAALDNINLNSLLLLPICLKKSKKLLFSPYNQFPLQEELGALKCQVWLNNQSNPLCNQTNLKLICGSKTKCLQPSNLSASQININNSNLCNNPKQLCLEDSQCSNLLHKLTQCQHNLTSLRVIRLSRFSNPTEISPQVLTKSQIKTNFHLALVHKKEEKPRGNREMRTASSRCASNSQKEFRKIFLTRERKTA
jgi:hypothetical protein